MAITAEQVKILRERTGAGMMECKAALGEANGNIDEAITVLRKRGLAKAATRSGRATKQGAVGTYIHMPVAEGTGPFGFAKLGVLVEVNCESDFVAKTDDFKTLVKELAMQVAAADPKWVSREQVPADAVDKEKEIYRAQMADSGKPAPVIEKIVEGKLGSFYERVCLLDQVSVRDGSVKVAQMIAAAVAKTGENITVSRFARFKLGEGAE
jgi:elongation factor Ts